MAKRRIRIIFNPAAAHGDAERDFPSVEPLLRESNIEFETARTEKRLDAIELARDAATAEVDAVVAAGGDGTANEVLNGLMRAKNDGIEIPAMGLIPIGRGNDFGYGVNVPRDRRRAVDIIEAGHSARIDVGFLKGGDFPDGKYFTNGIGIGFDTVVGLEAAKMKRLKGFLGYLVGAIKTIWLYDEAPLLKLTYNGDTITQRALMVSVMNGTRMGGAFYMAPRAATNDGLFDLVIAGNPKRRQILPLIVKFIRGSQEGNRFVQFDRVRDIEVEAMDGVLVVHADGEIICESGERLEVQCIPQAVDMLCEGER